MKSLNMQISAASTSLVRVNLPRASFLGAGPLSPLPARSFPFVGSAAVCAQHLLLLKVLDFLG